MNELRNKGSTPHKIGAQRRKLAEFIKCSVGIKPQKQRVGPFNVKNNPGALWSVFYVVGGVKGGLYIGSCRNVGGLSDFPSGMLFLSPPPPSLSQFHVIGALLESLRQ